MTGFIFYGIAVLIVLGVGLALVHFTNKSVSNVSKTEWLLGTLVSAALVIPLTTMAGTAIAKSNASEFYEYWNYQDKAHNVQVIDCEKNGSCRHTYQCDRYEEWVTKYRTEYYTDIETYTDANGNLATRTVQRSRQVPYQELETRYHECPYVTQEHTYTTTDSGDNVYTFGANWFPAQAEAHRWKGHGSNNPRGGGGLPGLPNVPQGVPADWTAAKAAIDNGTPFGHTERKKYKNPVQATSIDAYKIYKKPIDEFKAMDAMPKVTTKVEGHNNAHKVYFVGPKPKDALKWQVELERFNGEFGSKSQGDLHLVIVTDPAITNADAYTGALEAYWASEALGKDTLAKNAVAVVMKFTGSEIEWTRAFMGMPYGNKPLKSTIQEIKGKPASIDTLFAPETGVLKAYLMDHQDAFERVEMANYQYLYDSIDIGTGARLLILLVAMLLSGLIWAGLMVIDLRWAPVENLRAKARATVKNGPEESP